MDSNFSINKGKSRDPGKSPSAFASRRDEAWSDHDSQSSSTFYEVPSSHFLAQAGGLPSSSSRQPRLDSWNAHEKSGSITAAYPDVAQQESHTSSTLSSDGREQLSFIPDHISQGFHDLKLHLGGIQQPRAQMPDTSTLAAADFDVDVRSGFLPPEAPVSRLEGIEEELWECALDKARVLPLRIRGGGTQVDEIECKKARQWRRNIREMLILHPSPQITSDIRYARRAHLVLSWLAHFYIHSQPVPETNPSLSGPWYAGWSSRSQDELDKRNELVGKYSSTIPASIAVPWVALSKQLDLPPILTYATSVLWNWGLRDPSLGFKDDNVYITTTFSGTASEEHFFKTSLMIERRGVTALTLMRRSLDEAFVGDSLARRRISSYLKMLSRNIGDLTKLLHDVRLGCDPLIFYWGIRPWFNGGDSFIDKETGEKGWIYEGVEEYEGKRQVFTGPSAGQSALIHSLDVFLGVDHSKKDEEDANSSGAETATFMEKMQIYMPGHHRNFLTHLKGISFAPETTSTEEEDDETSSGLERHPLRALMACDDNTTAVELLQKSYNDTLTSLKHLRDEHMRVATTYIILQMRQACPPEYSTLDTNTVKGSQNTKSNPSEGAKGTGGTDLVSFLRDCRKNTIATLYSN